jgi:SRSO17 transposase
MATVSQGTHRLLALGPARQHTGQDSGQADKNPLAHRTRLRELKTGLGLSHFEGRSFHGFHHHATLVSAAHLFITRKRLATPKATGAA